MCADMYGFNKLINECLLMWVCVSANLCVCVYVCVWLCVCVRVCACVSGSVSECVCVCLLVRVCVSLSHAPCFTNAESPANQWAKIRSLSHLLAVILCHIFLADKYYTPTPNTSNLTIPTSTPSHLPPISSTLTSSTSVLLCPPPPPPESTQIVNHTTFENRVTEFALFDMLN